jgi:cytochrome P450
VKNYEVILEPSVQKMVYFVFHMLFPPKIIHALPWRMNTITRTTSANLKRICGDFVRDKREKMKRGGEEGLDVLSTLLRSGDFGDEGLVDQLLTFLAAGYASHH